MDKVDKARLVRRFSANDELVVCLCVMTPKRAYL